MFKSLPRPPGRILSFSVVGIGSDRVSHLYLSLPPERTSQDLTKNNIPYLVGTCSSAVSPPPNLADLLATQHRERGEDTHTVKCYSLMGIAPLSPRRPERIQADTGGYTITD